ncbi:hypothetical protein [Amycolatopsis sp. SID8362]|uniref:hypothetical protein n=1 Tax=Amycolatopsis sp. SID8362 TaxID=2690346 RepID=UPI001369A304|nr:hypothetical protein [Amycolatopsis sp. SID8362]NBH06667.1 hypothetical protein [Amycolatopsis sp. SID8362]NED43364.1 hypothetical protein [Amycolatopsis sp. SID8362]
MPPKKGRKFEVDVQELHKKVIEDLRWTVDDHKLTYGCQLTRSELGNLDSFMSYINREGVHPKKASEELGDMKYTVLSDKTGQCEIRLSGKNRASFIRVDETRTVEMRQAGGHV